MSELSNEGKQWGAEGFKGFLLGCRCTCAFLYPKELDNKYINWKSKNILFMYMWKKILLYKTRSFAVRVLCKRKPTTNKQALGGNANKPPGASIPFWWRYDEKLGRQGGGSLYMYFKYVQGHCDPFPCTMPLVPLSALLFCSPSWSVGWLLFCSPSVFGSSLHLADMLYGGDAAADEERQGCCLYDSQWMWCHARDGRRVLVRRYEFE